MGLFDHENTGELLGSLIKIGEVSSVDAATGTASVVFDDEDSVVTSELQVVHRNTFANRDYAMPDVGEDVLCLFTPEGDGFILGSFYAGEIAPPESSANRRCVEFLDGAKFTYDRDKHALTIVIGDTAITVNQSAVEVESKSTIHAKVGGTEATLSASGVSIKGDLTVTGNITASGSASAATVTASGAMTAAAITASGAMAAASVTATGTLTANTAVLTTPPTVGGVPMLVP